MVFELLTDLPPAEVLDRARRFFETRVPATGVFAEQRSGRHLVLRGQGGEEVVVAAFRASGGTMVRASSLLFDQQVKRFLSTLPQVEQGAA
jgi:hypothetical protein